MQRPFPHLSDRAGAARVVMLQPQAPTKPREGQPCNGCGVCCAAEPCPLGALLSLRRVGACNLLRWIPAQTRYGCGVLLWATGGNKAAAWLRVLKNPVRVLITRWIAAGKGCDCSLEVQAPV